MPSGTEQQELDRWEAMKPLKLRKLKYWEMVPELQEAGLLVCQPTHRKRVTGVQRVRDGEPATRTEICATCENTAVQTWTRNIAKLEESEADVIGVRWEWLEAHALIARVCTENQVVVAKVTTTRTETVDGKSVSTTTVREERRVNVAVMRLLSEVHDKMAKMAGIDVGDPESDEKLIGQPKMHVGRKPYPSREPVN